MTVTDLYEPSEDGCGLAEEAEDERQPLSGTHRKGRGGGLKGKKGKAAEPRERAGRRPPVRDEGSSDEGLDSPIESRQSTWQSFVCDTYATLTCSGVHRLGQLLDGLLQSRDMTGCCTHDTRTCDTDCATYCVTTPTVTLAVTPTASPVESRRPRGGGGARGRFEFNPIDEELAEARRQEQRRRQDAI